MATKIYLGPLSNNWVLFALLLVFLMPSNQSLWIDESTTALYTLTPTISAFADKLINDEIGSDAQYPLGNLYYWVGSRILGTSEVSLRALSALWIAVSIFIFWRIGDIVNIPFLPALFACNAFVWHYGGEARPYAMQIALGTGLLYSTVVVLKMPTKTARGIDALLISGPLLCATCMLGVIPFAIVSGVILVPLIRRKWVPRLRERIAIVGAGTFTLFLGIYYVWTLIEGKGAQTVGTWGVGLNNVIFATYELFGFMGFGPGRYDLRELGLAGGLSGAVTGLVRPSAVGVIVLLVLYFLTGQKFWTKYRSRNWMESQLGVPILGIIVTTFGVLFFLSVSVDFPFWGRHLAPILPFIVFLVAVAINDSGHTERPYRVLPLILCATMLASSLLVRFHPDHARDDYRSAARVSQSAVQKGEQVWWSASALPAIYYGLQFCESASTGQISCVEYVVNEAFDSLVALPAPAVVVTSKPDLYDKDGGLQCYLRDNDYRKTKMYKAFQVFEHDE